MKNMFLPIAISLTLILDVSSLKGENGIKKDTIDWNLKERLSSPIKIDKRDDESLTFYFHNLKKDEIARIELQSIRINNVDTPDKKIEPKDFGETILDVNSKSISINLVKLFSTNKLSEFLLATNQVTVNCLIKAKDSKSYTLILELDKEKNSKEDIKTSAEVQSLNFLPIPVFENSHKYTTNDNEKTRYLILDCNPNIVYKQNNVLYKRKTKFTPKNDNVIKFDEVLENSKFINVNSSISVLVKNYNLQTGERINVSLNGKNYEYDYDTKNLFSFKIADTITKISKNTLHDKTSDTTKPSQVGQTYSFITKYLNTTYKTISKNQSLNINDMYLVEDYKASLLNLVKKYIDTLDFATMEALGKIIYWSPEYISLTPIPVEIPETDEVNIKATITKNGKPTEISVGTYKTRGGMSLNLGSLFYITGLVNNEIYTKEVQVNDTSELRAFTDSTSKVSVGIGLNAEIYFRTGRLFKPTINLGVFVPLGQELVPYLALGPGFVVGNKDVKFSLNGGLAFGQVNEISKRYQNVDLTNVTELTSISQKVWKPSWYIGVGVSFNLTK